jgi:Tfp pilus assembly protein PilN
MGEGMRDIARQIGQSTHLRALIPVTLFQPGFFVPDPPVFVVRSLPLSDADGRGLADLAKRHDVIALHLDSSLGLQRTVTLPKAAAGRAEAVINMQMRQTLPAMANGLVWQFAQTGRTAQDVLFTVFVMKEDVLLQLQTAVETYGAAISEIRFAGVAGPALYSTKQKDAKTQRRWILATLFCVLAITSWAVWALEANVDALQTANAARSASNAALEEQLVGLTARINDAEGVRARLLADLSTFARQSERLAFWTDLTRDLPDAVWISELTVDADRMSLAGFTSGDATDVVETVQRQAWADTVRLEGPIQFDSAAP